MGQKFQVSFRRGGHGERLWLSALVDAMEQVSQPPPRPEACDGRRLAALRAQLALPAQMRFTSPFSLRN
ncbi:transcriptional regulator [Bradyrhizobium sp.]|uniref:transcriptional regulator n=1 Tax=Bradyrhizobium sp. TaxID=376 RepID=UPI001D33C7E8|nr:transcriptional regulator [Bradyrhizobium sp.]MBI5319213.1 transcriptional regulator [Bradyrhizobium sp.]